MQIGVLNELFAIIFHHVENVVHIGIQFPDFKTVTGMEGQSNHAVDGGKINVDAAVVISDIGGVQLLKLATSTMTIQVSLGVSIGAPDGGQAGGLGGRCIIEVAVVGGHG